MERAFEDQECIEVSSSCVYNCCLDLKKETTEVRTQKDLKSYNLTIANATLIVHQNYVYASHAIA